MRVLGIDLGIASCGWAVVEPDGETPRIVARGSSLFRRSPRRQDRRTQERGPPRRARPTARHPAPQAAHAKGARDPPSLRLARRRRERSAARRDAARSPPSRRTRMSRRGAFAPWPTIACSNDDEFSVVLGHIARHRGFRSNSKRDAGANAADETSKMKKAMEQTREGLAKYRSFGEMIESDPKFADRKRNRDKDYSHTPKRSDLEDEASFDLRRPTPFRQPARNAGTRSGNRGRRVHAKAAAGQRGQGRPLPVRTRRKAHRQMRAVVRTVPLPVAACEPAADGRPQRARIVAGGNRASRAWLRRTEKCYFQDLAETAGS